MSVNEGDSVTLHTGVETKHQEEIKWYFNSTRIAQISGDLSFICTDVQCNEGTERFRDRLKLDHLTGSLTIMNTRNTDSGEYKLLIINNNKYFNMYIIDRVSGVDTVSVNEGDSVTLITGVQTNQQEEIKWYFSITRVAKISGDLSYICTDVQCNEGTERFRDRLKLDHRTGSLTIMNIRNTDSGEYQLLITSDTSNSGKIFNVTVRGVSAAERDEVKTVEEGESVTLGPGVINNPNDEMTWYFNEILIAEITGDQSKICTDDQCDERFRDRLKLDHLTGSLTNTNTRNTDSGEYKLLIIIINSSSFSITTVKRFNVTVTGSGLSSGAVAGIVVAAVVLLVFAAAVFYYCRSRSHTEVPQTDADAANSGNCIPLTCRR
ncbi:carcinoembryonic antigen-related cell adhesion molecule 1-like [Chanodichthys erythropterus]|uniref:carcinoembryonic antigen-related cell adhesion molecule 1-like n=1 Tax=Chanodichthys erythropterus TaxID=933992 RepID=UPI00351E198B